MLFNRALHIDDYNHLAHWVNEINEYEAYLSQQRVPYRKDHKHREWEYASCWLQLDKLGVQPPARILDTGSGGSYFPLFLATRGYKIDVSDSMEYGDFVKDYLIPQCIHQSVEIPVHRIPVEDMSSIPDATYDVAMCISVIEHVHPDSFEDGLKELKRVTKPNGYIFLTSDFFQNEEQANASPYRSIQHNLFMPHLMMDLPARMGHGVSFVGDHPDFQYRGDFVHNYSFVNVCLQKQPS